MGTTEDLADQLAQETIAAMEKLGDEDLIAEVAKMLGATSTTTQEAFMTAVRVRLSEQRARTYLAMRLAKGPQNPAQVGKVGAVKFLDPADGDNH
jgi:ribosomal protein S28E/S33